MTKPISLSPFKKIDNSHQLGTDPYAFLKDGLPWLKPLEHISADRKSRRSALRRNELGYVDSLRVLNGHRRIEETISGDEVAGGAGVFEDADCSFVDGVVYDDVVVARDEDAGLGSVENLIVTDPGLIALDANAIENGGGESLVALDSSIAAVNEDVHLADASRIARDLYTIRLCDENVCGDSGVGGDRGTRRPNVVGHNIVEN